MVGGSRKMTAVWNLKKINPPPEIHLCHAASMAKNGGRLQKNESVESV